MNRLATTHMRSDTALPQHGRGKTILVADDHEESRETLARLLEAFGFQVVQARDGGEALARMGGQKPDMLVLDLMMPVMNGWEVLYQIQGDTKLSRIPVVVLSGVADLEAMEEEDLPVVFLEKPVEPEALLHLLEHYCPPVPV